MTIHVQIFDADPAVARDLQRTFEGLASVTVRPVDRMRYHEPPAGIDVLYLPLPVAEPFGSKPVWHESLVLPVPSEYQQRGMPGFVVTGTGLLPGDARGPIPELQLLLTCVFRALQEFNQREQTKLERVGFWACNLLDYHQHRALTADQVRDVLLAVVPELRQ